MAVYTNINKSKGIYTKAFSGYSEWQDDGCKDPAFPSSVLLCYLHFYRMCDYCCKPQANKANCICNFHWFLCTSINSYILQTKPCKLPLPTISPGTFPTLSSPTPKFQTHGFTYSSQQGEKKKKPLISVCAHLFTLLSSAQMSSKLLLITLDFCEM